MQHARHGARGPVSARWLPRLVLAGGGAGLLLIVVVLVRPSTLSTTAGSAATTRHLAWLALYLLVLVGAPVQHDGAVSAAGTSSIRVRSLLHLTLNGVAVLGAFALFPAALVWRAWWFLLALPVGFALGLRSMRYAERAAVSPAEWRRERVASLIASGVALHFALVALVAIGWLARGAPFRPGA